jgi:TetR/AcrR family transcriptional regulator
MDNTAKSEAVQPDARERLLAAALEQFTQRGYASTTVRELCEAAGVTKPVLYYYFKSKEGLYLELMDSSYALFESTLAELVARPGKPLERLIHFCQGIFDISSEQKQVVRLIFSIFYGPPQGGAPHYDFERYYARILEVIAQILQEGVAGGEIRDIDIVEMSWAVLSHLNIAIEEQLCPGEPRVDKAMMVRMILMLFDGIKTK